MVLCGFTESPTAKYHIRVFAARPVKRSGWGVGMVWWWLSTQGEAYAEEMGGGSLAEFNNGWRLQRLVSCFFFCFFRVESVHVLVKAMSLFESSRLFKIGRPPKAADKYTKSISRHYWTERIHNRIQPCLIRISWLWQAF